MAKLRDVRFETVSLVWNGSHESAAKANYFYLTFDMGPEQARAFAELPSILSCTRLNHPGVAADRLLCADRLARQPAYRRIGGEGRQEQPSPPCL